MLCHNDLITSQNGEDDVMQGRASDFWSS